MIPLEQLAEWVRSAKEFLDAAEEERAASLRVLRDHPLTPGAIERFTRGESRVETCQRLLCRDLLRYFEASEGARAPLERATPAPTE